MFGIGLVTIVTHVNYWVKEVLEDYVALLVTGYSSHCHDEWMSRIVHSSLDALIQGSSLGCLQITQLGIHLESIQAHINVLKKLRHI